jgi:membrane fusion protein, multidrug efflux system
VTVASDVKPPGGAFRRFLIAVLFVGLALFFYFGFFALVGYTDDAYIRSDVIRIAPEVSGPITAVHFRDNDHVEAGATLLTIDPAPFQLAVEAKRDRVESARAVVALKTEARASQTANIEAAEAALDLAQSDSKRVVDLAARGFAAQQELDKSRDTLRSSQSALAYAKAQAIVADREVDAMQRDVKSAEAELAIAEYNLSRTELKAGSSGYLNNFNISPGRYAAAGESLIGVIDDKSWRVIANFKEDVAASVAPGKAVWVWLDTHPWRLYRGHVQSVARGIARNETPEQLLPYVAPTTDWVRLRRRFPVTITLDPPAPRDVLYMGADARVFFWR